MEKSADAFRSIGEMAEDLGVRTHILRYWEEQFPMLRPLKRAGGRRHYRPEDVILLRTIHRLLGQEGYTIKGARKFLTGGGSSVMSAPVTSAPVMTASAPPFDMPALRAIRDRLSAALAVA